MTENTKTNLVAILVIISLLTGLVFFLRWIIPYNEKSNKEYYQKQKAIFLECQQKTQDIEWCYQNFIK